jgi:hypothetical protein
MPTPREVFEENIRPAELLVCIHTLLENDGIQTDGDLVSRVRERMGYGAAEALMLISNAVFLGVIREQARVHATDLRRSRLDNLLRQAVVASCSALETYLYALLETHLTTVVQALGKNFLPSDRELMQFLRGIEFKIDDALRIMTDPDSSPLFIANKILTLVQQKYVKGVSGVHAAGTMLGLDNPWTLIATALARKVDDLREIVKRVTDRRNDIVHRADRPATNPNGPIQEIHREQVSLDVGTVGSICRTLDRLVGDRLKELGKRAALTPAQEVP